MFKKLLYLIFVSLHYNSVIILNDKIFVGIVTFLYVSKYSDEKLFCVLLCMSSVHKY